MSMARGPADAVREGAHTLTGASHDYDPLLDRVTLVGQPTVVADQATIAHPADHAGDLLGRKVVDSSELVGRHVHVQGQQQVRLQPGASL